MTRLETAMTEDHFALTDQPIDVTRLLERVQDPALGGVVLFLGTVRSHNRQREVVELHYEAYPEMAVAQMKRLGRELRGAHPEVARIVVEHRTGTLRPGDVAVAIACAAPHREAAFAATRRYIERLKEDVPIWKRERYPDGTSWLAAGP